MNENLNLVKLLKDCPKGIEFYSIVYGDVYFDCIDLSRQYPVTIKTSDGGIVEVASNGLHYLEYDGECTLFPSREQRDWSKWQRPFVDGDIIFTYIKGVVYDTKWLSIFRRTIDNRCETYVYMNISDRDFYINDDESKYFCNLSNIKYQRFATDEEKKLLFDAIKKHGYRWNTDTKTLEKLIVPKFKVGDSIQSKTDNNDKFTITTIDDNKFYYGCGNGHEFMIPVVKQNNWELISDKFDPKTLKPFDKVLGRYTNDGTWKALYFSHLSNGDRYPYHCGSISYSYCIPYNEETKHLTGTDEDAPSFYRYWED